ncbi:MAG: hypothetical protein ACREJ3_02570, partial [Polyangiaceae bacterium]
MAKEAPELLQARIELLTRFKAALVDWHDGTEKLEEENLTFAAVQGPLAPGPEIVEVRSLINRNLVAARQAVQDAGVYCTVAGNVDGTLQSVDPFTNVFGKVFGESFVP